MYIISKIRTNRDFVLNMTASVVIHIFLFFIVSLTLYFTADQDVMRSPYVEIYTTNSPQSFQESEVVEEETPLTEPEETEINKEEEMTTEEKEIETQTPSGFISLSETSYDTTGLKNVYKESTLNVRIKYPVGWTFIDQNVKNKLDGVTFWASRGNYDPPPYIHLEVKEKYLFNPSRYKYKEEMGDFTAYFNDPKELSGQVSQEIYLVTDTEEDFSIKLIMEGEENFKSFQPVFFGMLKTFKFGKSLF